VAPMERASVAMDGDSRTAMDGPNPKQSCPLEWVSQVLTKQLQSDNFILDAIVKHALTLLL
jgi:hypothetical protein